MYSTGELQRVAGVSRREIDTWDWSGVIQASERGGRGRGRHRRFSLVQVVAVAVARSIRRHGAGLDVARAAVQAITRLSEPELRAAVAAAHDRLVLVGCVAAETLLSVRELAESPSLARIRESGEAIVTMVDVGGVLAAVDRRIREVAQAQ